MALYCRARHSGFHERFVWVTTGPFRLDDLKKEVLSDNQPYTLVTVKSPTSVPGMRDLEALPPKSGGLFRSYLHHAVDPILRIRMKTVLRQIPLQNYSPARCLIRELAHNATLQKEFISR